MAVTYTEKAWLNVGSIAAGGTAHGVLRDGTRVFVQPVGSTWRTVYGSVVVTGFTNPEDAVVDLQNALRADGIYLLRRG